MTVCRLKVTARHLYGDEGGFRWTSDGIKIAWRSSPCLHGLHSVSMAYATSQSTLELCVIGRDTRILLLSRVLLRKLLLEAERPRRAQRQLGGKITVDVKPLQHHRHFDFRLRPNCQHPSSPTFLPQHVRPGPFGKIRPRPRRSI